MDTPRPRVRWWQGLLTAVLIVLTCGALLIVAAVSLFGASACRSSPLDLRQVHEAQAVMAGSCALALLLWGGATALSRGRSDVLVGLVLSGVVSAFILLEAFSGFDYHDGFCF